MTPPVKQRHFFKHLGKEHSNCFLLAELKDIIVEEWGKIDRRTYLLSNMSRLYSFKAEDVKRLEAATLVDAVVIQLAKRVTLPLEDAMSFKYSLERRIDLDLKIIYVFDCGFRHQK